VLAAIRLSKATIRKMMQPVLGSDLQSDRHFNCRGRPVPIAGSDAPTRIRALAMSASSITVVSNAMLLRRSL